MTPIPAPKQNCLLQIQSKSAFHTYISSDRTALLCPPADRWISVGAKHHQSGKTNHIRPHQNSPHSTTAPFPPVWINLPPQKAKTLVDIHLKQNENQRTPTGLNSIQQQNPSHHPLPTPQTLPSPIQASPLTRPHQSCLNPVLSQPCLHFPD